MGPDDMSLGVPRFLTAGCSILRARSAAAVVKPTLRPSIKRPFRIYSDARSSPKSLATPRIPITIRDACRNFATAIPIGVCVFKPKSSSPPVCEEEPQRKTKNRREVSKENRSKTAQEAPIACDPPQSAEDNQESSSGGVVAPHRQNGHKCHGQREYEETTNRKECEQSESHRSPPLKIPSPAEIRLSLGFLGRNRAMWVSTNGS